MWTVRTLQLMAFILAALAPFSPAQACSGERFDSTINRVETFEAVVRARVIQAKVRSVSDFGVACRFLSPPERCDLLELHLEMLEVFSGDAENYTTIYAPVLPVCREPVLVGLEYVFFLETYEGLIAPNANSFQVYGQEAAEKLNALRER
jgi:hypothetical protein